MPFLEVDPEVGQRFFSQASNGPVVMLNLLRFLDEADYARAPALKPKQAVSGWEAYKLYLAHAFPFIEEAGSKVLYSGKCDAFLIGPSDERWDRALLVEHQSIAHFLEFASNKAYLAGMGHRLAALEDSRLLPMS